ncbi:MAG: hypothetical protein HOI66_22210 [Verrucomicrobia bacterium]|jgi:amidase|nr:hypothetical protein [Verrucomicrobiota bacterium]
MQRIQRDQANKFAFNSLDTPLLKIVANETIEVETDDASSGYFKSEDDLAIPSQRPGFDRNPPMANPIAGPIFVEGAERGDTLVVKIETIEVDSYSWIAIGPNRGPLGNSSRWPALSSEYTTKIFPHTPGPSGTTVDGTLEFNKNIKWPITPFIGTIGVAPDREVTTSIDGQGEWGGNLDIRDCAPGNEIHLPVYHPGALLYLGDVHASQGDTEFTGTAAETKSTVRLQVEIIKNQAPDWLRIVKPQSLIAVNAARPLELAVETATIQLISWLVRDYHFTPQDAYCIVSTCPDFRINVYQMCDIAKLRFVAGAEIPKKYLPNL